MEKKEIHYWYLIVPVLIFICGCLTGFLPSFVGAIAFLLILFAMQLVTIIFIILFCVRCIKKASKKQLIVDGLCIVMSLIVFVNIDNMEKCSNLIKDYKITKNYLKEKFGSSYHIKGFTYYNHESQKEIDGYKCDFVFEVYLDDLPNETFEAGYCYYSKGPFTRDKVVTTLDDKNDK